MRQVRWLASALLASVAVMGVVRSAAADDAESKSDPLKRPKVTRSQGVIRMIGPDGKVQEQRFGLGGAAQIEGLEAKLQELRQAAGDREAVERISQELLKLVQSAGAEPGAAAGTFATDSVELPKFGIGVSLSPNLPAAVRAQLKLGDGEGVLVQSVAKDGPAAKAGIREYDVLLAVDGRVIRQHSDMVDAVQNAGEAGAAVKLDLISGGEHTSVDVKPSPSQEIDWALSSVAKPAWTGPPDVFTLRMYPGMVGAPELYPLPEDSIHNRIQLFTPAVDARKLAERVEKLERQLQALSEQMSDKKSESQQD